jgi:hypothetical protein
MKKSDDEDIKKSREARAFLNVVGTAGILG